MRMINEKLTSISNQSTFDGSSDSSMNYAKLQNSINFRRSVLGAEAIDHVGAKSGKLPNPVTEVSME